jgi:hypothetical protein
MCRQDCLLQWQQIYCVSSRRLLAAELLLHLALVTA